MTEIRIDLEAAKRCLTDSIRLISDARNEQVVRDSFTSYLRHIFPDEPNWVTRHIQGSEFTVSIVREATIVRGFVDNLVDLTAIEYESNLTSSTKYNAGLNQVKDYCASLVNQGHRPELIVGILSDTVRWYAFEVEVHAIPIESYDRDSIGLTQVEYIDCSTVSDRTASDLVRFLIKYVGRIGARPVSAISIAKDLGFNSDFCQSHIASLEVTVREAFSSNPGYSALISELWSNFVGYLREEGRASEFDLTTYVDEFYIVTLGKLICANYLAEQALSSNNTELRAIIDGTYFENKGLLNFVEYDYFGWLNSGEYIESILPIARAIQSDLRAYNFNSKPSEDLFGTLMAQLANRSQRLLLGQEWTPSWLSSKLVNHVVEKLGEAPLRIIDMCCGSGSMIVETLKIAKRKIEASDPNSTHGQKVEMLIQSITGFDIDPLAVMLSKINWVLAASDWIQPLGSHSITIPIYHADSLFAITPVSNSINDADRSVYTLKVAEYSIELPAYLISPTHQSLFDNLIDSAYRLTSAGGERPIQLSPDEVLMSIRSAAEFSEIQINSDQEIQIAKFFSDFVTAVDLLNRDGRNGIWAYIMKNSFRPGLVAGQFNGLVSNPPWLALSKIANNPYQTILKNMAIRFNIKPNGSSHLHIELATIFLLHAIQHYLVDAAVVGCIVPETILNGHHHNRFRKAEFFLATEPIAFSVDEIWRVPHQVFKNNAVILFGSKSNPDPESHDTIPGAQLVVNGPTSQITFYRNFRGTRTAWGEEQLRSGDVGLYTPAGFRQGADVMPRNLLFYETTETSDSRTFEVESINAVTSEIAFTIKDAKKHQSFSLSRRILPKDLFFNVITSNLLTPFEVADSQLALLPIRKNSSNVWQALSVAEISAKGVITKNSFDEICRTLSPENATIENLFDVINTRGKLSQQIISPLGFIVMTGAGGGKVCASYISALDRDFNRLVMDQTIYWAQVSNENEAIYLTGLLNSDAISSIIREFQPRGAFGERHVHTLPFGVTPPFDESQVSHLSVVDATRNLMSEYAVLRNTIGELLNPNSGSLSSRRKKIFQKIKELPSFDVYEAACRDLYGI
jgi:hypothetical protein